MYITGLELNNLLYKNTKPDGIDCTPKEGRHCASVIFGLIWHLKEQLIIIELSQFQKPDGY